jgi:DNA-binding CsgD family transcriptional regulator
VVASFASLGDRVDYLITFRVDGSCVVTSTLERWAKLQPREGGDAPAYAGHWQTALRAQRASSLTSLPLSSCELLVAKLFADDQSAEVIALALGLSPGTVRAYLVHMRLKYKNAGRDASTKLRLRALLIADRLLSE